MVHLPSETRLCSLSPPVSAEMRAVKTIIRVLCIALSLLFIFVSLNHAAPTSIVLQSEATTRVASFWEGPWDWASRKFSDIRRKIEDQASNSLKLPSWEKIESFGSGLLKEADKDLNDAIKAWHLEDNVLAFRTTFKEVLYEANALKKDFAYLTDQGFVSEDFSSEIALALQEVLKELQQAFPPPNHAPGHAHRQNMTRIVFGKAEAALLNFAQKHGMPEDKIESFRASLDRINPLIEKLVVTTGDLAEQHPILLDTLLFTATALLIPESWFLRPLMSLFGFGPFGPVKGTSAAWAQRTFWGAAVKKNSWFSMLQRAGMKGTVPRKVIGGIGAGVGVGAGVLC